MRKLLECTGLFRDFLLILEWPKYFSFIPLPLPKLSSKSEPNQIAVEKEGFPCSPLCSTIMENALFVRSELLAAAVLARSREDFELNVWLLKVFGFGV